MTFWSAIELVENNDSSPHPFCGWGKLLEFVLWLYLSNKKGVFKLSPVATKARTGNHLLSDSGWAPEKQSTWGIEKGQERSGRSVAGSVRRTACIPIKSVARMPKDFCSIARQGRRWHSKTILLIPPPTGTPIHRVCQKQGIIGRPPAVRGKKRLCLWQLFHISGQHIRRPLSGPVENQQLDIPQECQHSKANHTGGSHSQQ